MGTGWGDTATLLVEVVVTVLPAPPRVDVVVVVWLVAVSVVVGASGAESVLVPLVGDGLVEGCDVPLVPPAGVDDVGWFTEATWTALVPAMAGANGMSSDATQKMQISSRRRIGRAEMA